MKQFIWNLRCMITSYKYRHEYYNEYGWYKYLVKYDWNQFWRRINSFNKIRNDLFEE